ncbi:hypothetical protein LJC07_08715, partial [Christensenellaceae bacterium OttesenSCG-928-L17]|nr:hypothetical protein [Christensenellaceae bacterium OttesenSCG-928-L17]
EISVAPPEASKKRWEEDAKFRAQLTWCLCLPDENAKRALLTLMESFGGYEAERALRKFLLEPLQPDAVKQDVFTMLKRMGAREPYIAYLGGRLVQSRVRVRYAKESDGVPAAYMRVYRQITENMPTRCAVETILCAMELFEQYTTNTEPLPPLRPMQEAAVAAAFEYIARRVMKEPITQTEVAEAYGVSTIRLRNAVGRIRAGLKEE